MLFKTFCQTIVQTKKLRSKSKNKSPLVCSSKPVCLHTFIWYVYYTVGERSLFGRPFQILSHWYRPGETARRTKKRRKHAKMGAFWWIPRSQPATHISLFRLTVCLTINLGDPPRFRQESGQFFRRKHSPSQQTQFRDVAIDTAL